VELFLVVKPFEGPPNFKERILQRVYSRAIGRHKHAISNAIKVKKLALLALETDSGKAGKECCSYRKLVFSGYHHGS
jgi:hypothetical protein